jgi:hypothetical protein
MPSPNTRLLVVDDEPLVCKNMSIIFTALGYATRTALDGFLALAVIREEIPDIILSDLNMPGMSGFELLSIVRRRFPSIRVVAMSDGPSGRCSRCLLPKGEPPPTRAAGSGGGDGASRKITSSSLFPASRCAHLDSDKRARSFGRTVRDDFLSGMPQGVPAGSGQEDSPHVQHKMRTLFEPDSVRDYPLDEHRAVRRAAVKRGFRLRTRLSVIEQTPCVVVLTLVPGTTSSRPAFHAEGRARFCMEVSGRIATVPAGRFVVRNHAAWVGLPQNRINYSVIKPS